MLKISDVLSDIKKTRVYQDALQEGRQEGRQEGLLEARQEMSLQLLSRRIGTVTPEQTAAIQALPFAQLLDLVEALPGFTQSRDLTEWLAAQWLVTNAAHATKSK